MAAIVIDGYGEPDRLHADRVAVPKLDSGAVLIEVAAAGTGKHLAALAINGATTLRGIDDELDMQLGHRIALSDAFGGVGYAALQLAKALGTHALPSFRDSTVQSSREEPLPIGWWTAVARMSPQPSLVAREKPIQPQESVSFWPRQVFVFARFRRDRRQKLAISHARAREGFR